MEREQQEVVECFLARIFSSPRGRAPLPLDKQQVPAAPQQRREYKLVARARAKVNSQQQVTAHAAERQGGKLVVVVDLKNAAREQRLN